MIIYGLDFTSAPSAAAPMACARCELSGERLALVEMESFADWAGFESFLGRDGPWLAALDFPFGQPKRLIDDLGWPRAWADYVARADAMGKAAFEKEMTDYCARQPSGEKHHFRKTDRLAEGLSPMMLFYTPLGKMFFEGSPRLLHSKSSVMPCRPTDDARIVIEGYPALAARKAIGKRTYKGDKRKGESEEIAAARRELIEALAGGSVGAAYGVEVALPDGAVEGFAAQASADKLDAMLCALQAAWAYRGLRRGHGVVPRGCDPDEGWIVDPAMLKMAEKKGDK